MSNADESLRPFFEEAGLVKEEMASIRELVGRMEEANKEGKSARRPEALRAIRDRIGALTVDVLNSYRWSLMFDLQKLPVTFALDRAGLVGADGPTHCGSFDVTYMACLPNMIVMAPSDEAELFHMVATAVAIDDRPSCFRYPRGNGVGVPLPLGNKGVPIKVGKERILMEGERVALLGYGVAVQGCLAAAAIIEHHGLRITVADAISYSTRLSFV